MMVRNLRAFLRGPALAWVLTGSLALVLGLAAGHVSAAEARVFADPVQQR
jgi:hypothetical protein